MANPPPPFRPGLSVGIAGVIQASFVARFAAAARAVPVPAERFRTPSPGGGKPLPAAVQGKMEALFGADFSQVRIHVGDRPAALGAVAFAHGSDLHFAHGRYDPATPAGQRLLGHELAHVVQQRAGRARNPFGTGLALVQDPALEAEAERMGLRAMTALAAPAPRPVAPGRVAQPYFKIAAERVFTSREAMRGSGARALVSDEASLHAQQEGGEEFLDTGRARIVSAVRATLRVSDDGRMAIEDSDLSTRQPKVFFATADVFRASNAALRDVVSDFRLAQGGETVRIITASGREHVLRSAYPVFAAAPAAARDLSLTASQNCNDMATSVIGARASSTAVVASPPGGVPSGVRTIDTQIHNTVADLVVKVLKKAETGSVYNLQVLATAREWKYGEGERRMREAVNRISREYAEAVESGSPDALLRKFGINRHAAPEVGDAFVIHGVATADERGEVTDWSSRRSFQPRWPYHWGGVVAKSGTDVVTLENYDRDSGTSKSKDPRWYFQMYGQGRAQSFHEAWAASGAFANPMTLAMRNPRRPAPRTNWAGILILLVIAVLILFGFLRR
jgi:hypothetical protein